MKKFITLIIILSLVFSLIACKDNTAPQEESDIKDCINCFATMDEYLLAWQDAQTNPKSDLCMFGDIDGRYTIIPSLMTDEYELITITAYYTRTSYFYKPSEPDKSLDDNTIRLNIWKADNTYQLSLKEQPTETDGIGYNSKYNYWIIDYNSRKITILFPDSIVLQSEEELWNYFTFDEVKYKP